MNSHFVMATLLSLGVLLAGCDKAAPPKVAQKDMEVETPEKKLADLVKRAERGEASAQSALGEMYNKGEGVSKDAAKAFEWTQKAAAQGNADAQNNLGLMYILGGGVPSDKVLAYAWVNLSFCLRRV